MNTSKHVLSLTKLYARQIRLTSTEVPSKRFQRIKELQKQYQIDDGVPVYLKGGVRDKALFGLTLGLLAVGLTLAGETVYRLVKK